MAMPGRRSNYSLLTQIPDDDQLQPPPLPGMFSGGSGGGYESQSGEKKRGGFDWDLIDQRMQQNRIGGLQRQSSGSSYGESSISGDYFVPAATSTIAVADPVAAAAGDGSEVLRLKSSVGSYSSKSWAQQTEESYQLQLALALRLSSEAMSSDDPNLLDPVTDETTVSSSSSSAESLSHRFWVSISSFHTIIIIII